MKIKSQRARLALCTAILALNYTPLLLANPNGAHILHGQANIDTSTPNLTTITNSPNAIIQWQTFNIAEKEITRFVQQNNQSVVLNRVIGGNPSEILGQLISNGKVLLINQSGVVFGANAVIDTQSLITSSLNLSDNDFLKGSYHFIAGEKAGNIANEGIIRAGKNGNIILIAPNISNKGSLSSEHGTLTLAAGQELTLTSLDNPNISFIIQSPNNEILNVGQLLAEKGVINLFASSIQHKGKINADSVQSDAQGNIELIAQNALTPIKTATNKENQAQWQIFADDDIAIQSVMNSQGALLSANRLMKALNNGTAISVNSTKTDGNIAVQSFVNKTTGNDAKLTLNAKGDIDVDANIRAFKNENSHESVGKLDIVLNANSDKLKNGHVNLKSITLDANGGNIDATNQSVVVNNNDIETDSLKIRSTMTIGSLNLVKGAINTSDILTIRERLVIDSGLVFGTGSLITLAGSQTDLNANASLINIDWTNNGLVNINDNNATVSLPNTIPDNILHPSQWHNVGTINWYKMPANFNYDASMISLNNSGTLNIAGNSINESFAFKLGAFNNSGTVNLNNALLRISPEVNFTQTGIINIAGNANLTSKGFSNDGTIHNSGTLDINGTLINHGKIDIADNATLNLAQGSSISTGELTNKGTINVNSGSLSVQNAGANSGIFNVLTSARLNFDGTSPQLSAINGNGDVYFNVTEKLVLPVISAHILQAICSEDIVQQVVIQADNLVLSTDKAYINEVGGQALAQTGHWLIYSNNWQDSIENGLVAQTNSTYPRLYNMSYDKNAPDSIEAGNHFIYKSQPTVIINAKNQIKTYGDADPLLTYTVTGLVNDDGVIDSNYLTGLLTRANGQNVGQYRIEQGTLFARNNYLINYTPAILNIEPLINKASEQVIGNASRDILVAVTAPQTNNASNTDSPIELASNGSNNSKEVDVSIKKRAKGQCK